MRGAEGLGGQVTAITSIPDDINPLLAQLEVVSASEEGQVCVWGFERDIELDKLDNQYREVSTHNQ